MPPDYSGVQATLRAEMFHFLSYSIAGLSQRPAGSGSGEWRAVERQLAGQGPVMSTGVLRTRAVDTVGMLGGRKLCWSHAWASSHILGWPLPG